LHLGQMIHWYQSCLSGRESRFIKEEDSKGSGRGYSRPMLAVAVRPSEPRLKQTSRLR